MMESTRYLHTLHHIDCNISVPHSNICCRQKKKRKARKLFLDHNHSHFTQEGSVRNLSRLWLNARVLKRNYERPMAASCLLQSSRYSATLTLTLTRTPIVYFCIYQAEEGRQKGCGLPRFVADR